MKNRTLFSSQHWLWIIFLVAFGLRFWLLYRFNFALGWEADGFPKSDAREYDVLAMNILMGRGFGDYIFGFKYQSFVSPFYPLFLAFIYSFFGHNYMAVKIVQLVLSSLNPVIIYAIGKRLFNKPIGVIAGLIMACYVPYMFWVSALMRETLFTFVFACACLSTLKAMDESSKKHLILAGITIGIAILVRPGGLVLLSVLIFGGWAKRKIKPISVIFLFALLTVFPWIVRSMVIHQGPIILEASGARQFWTGANPEYGGDFYERRAWHKSLWDEPLASEAERYKRLNREAYEFIRENPQRYLEYFRKRLGDFWHLKTLNVMHFNRKSIEVWLPYLVIWLGTIGIVHSIYFFSFRRSLPLISLILFYCLGVGMYGGIPRYRMPLEQFFIIFAAYTVYGLNKIRRAEWREMKILDVDAPSQWSPCSYRILRFFTLCGSLLILIFSIRLCIAYWGPGEKIVEPNVDKKQIQLSLKNHSLLEEWERQVPQELTYQDIFLDQAANDGFLTKYKDHLVVWKGRIDYITKDMKGNIKNFRLTLNPGPHSFGQEDFHFSRGQGAKIKAEHFKERDIVFVIARIRGTGRHLADPQVEFYEILGEPRINQK